MPTTIFQPTIPTTQSRPKVKISNFCVFCPIWMKFGKAKRGLKAYSLIIQNPPKIFLWVSMVSEPPGMCTETLTDTIL